MWPVKFTVTRYPSAGGSTLGTLYIDGDFECFTCEDIIRAPGVKVPGQTAIPPGAYPLTLDWSNRFQKQMPHVMNVPGFDGIRIHPGNTAADTEGCLLVGLTKLPAAVGQSRIAFQALMLKLEAGLRDGGTATIEYLNPSEAVAA